MSRDLTNYQEEYAAAPYEPYQAAFRKRKILEILSRFNHATLLEVGCGLESIFHSINSFDYLTVIEPGLIFYDKAVEDLKLTPYKDKVRIVRAVVEDAYELVKNERFDFILASGLIHEVSNPKQVMESIRGIANPKTVIHVNAPNAKSFHRLLAVEMGLIKSEFEKSSVNIRLQQHTVFDLESLSSLATESGFVVIESGSYCFKPFTHEQMQGLLDAGWLNESMLEGLYKMEKYLPGLGSEIYVNVKIA